MTFVGRALKHVLVPAGEVLGRVPDIGELDVLTVTGVAGVGGPAAVGELGDLDVGAGGRPVSPVSRTCAGVRAPSAEVPGEPTAPLALVHAPSASPTVEGSVHPAVIFVEAVWPACTSAETPLAERLPFA